MLLTEFESLPADRAAELVRVWADVPDWVATLVAERPFGSVSALSARAAELAREWTEDDLDAALSHHPRIGDRPAESGAEADHSRREQASMSDAAVGMRESIAAGNAEYERRFGRVFLIRAAGRSPEEMLGELERRLGNPPEAEWREAAGQLAEIALLRLRAALHDTDTDTEPDPAEEP